MDLFQFPIKGGNTRACGVLAGLGPRRSWQSESSSLQADLIAL